MRLYIPPKLFVSPLPALTHGQHAHLGVVRLFTLLLSLLLSPAVFSQAVQTAAKLNEAVEQAVMTSPDVQFAYKNYQAVVKERDAAMGRFLPAVDFSYTAGQEDKADPIPNVIKNFSRNQTSLSLRQLLFDGGSAKSDVSRLDASINAKLFELQNAANITAIETTKAYIDLIRYRALVTLSEDNYVAHKVIFEQLKLKANSGVGKRSDVEQAQSRLALAEYNLNVEGSNLHDAEAKYQRYTGKLPPIGLDANLPVDQGIPISRLDALAKAQLNNPSLLATVMDIKAQQSMIKMKAAAFAPRVEFKARQDNGENLSGYIGQHRASVTEVVMSWNLFNGNTDTNLRRKEQDLLQAAENRRDLTCRNMRLELGIAYNDIRKMTEQLKYLDSRQIAIERARDAYRQQFEIGQRSLVDLLNSENEVFESKRMYTNILQDRYYAYARVHHHLGSLLQLLNVERYGSKDAPLPEVQGEHFSELANACPLEAPNPYQANHNNLNARATELLLPPKNAIKPNPLNLDFMNLGEDGLSSSRPSNR